MSRLFNKDEISNVKEQKSFNCFAKRFAAKEAFSKALEQVFLKEFILIKL